MYLTNYPFVRVGLKLLFVKVCSKMQGLQSRGCNIKNGPTKARSGVIKNITENAPPLLTMSYKFCFMKFSVKCSACLEEVFYLQEAGPRTYVFQTYSKAIPRS